MGGLEGVSGPDSRDPENTKMTPGSPGADVPMGVADVSTGTGVDRYGSRAGRHPSGRVADGVGLTGASSRQEVRETFAARAQGVIDGSERRPRQGGSSAWITLRQPAGARGEWPRGRSPTGAAWILAPARLDRVYGKDVLRLNEPPYNLGRPGIPRRLRRVAVPFRENRAPSRKTLSGFVHLYADLPDVVFPPCPMTRGRDPKASGEPAYARSYIRASENCPSETVRKAWKPPAG